MFFVSQILPLSVFGSSVYHSVSNDSSMQVMYSGSSQNAPKSGKNLTISNFASAQLQFYFLRFLQYGIMVPSNLLQSCEVPLYIQTVKSNAISSFYYGQICFRVLCFTIIRQKLGYSVDQAGLVILPLAFWRVEARQMRRCDDQVQARFIRRSRTEDS